MDKDYIKHLIQRISEQSDQKAFELLFKLFHNRLLRFSIHYVHSKELAEEIVSDVFIKLWNNRQDCASILNLETYLYIATKNQSLNYVSRLSNYHISPIQETGLHELVDSFDPEKELELQELEFDMNVAIESLPTQCKVVFKLIKEDGFKYKEVAQILNVSVRTVETQLVRALKKLDIALMPHIVSKKKTENPTHYPNISLVLGLFYFFC